MLPSIVKDLVISANDLNLIDEYISMGLPMENGIFNPDPTKHATEILLLVRNLVQIILN